MELHTGNQTILGGLGDTEITTSKVVAEGQLCSIVDLHSNTSLNRRNHIASRSVGFLHRILQTDRHVGECRYTLGICLSGHIDGRTSIGSSGQCECEVTHNTIFGGLRYLNSSDLELILDRHRSLIVDGYGNINRFDRLIVCRCIDLGHSIASDKNIGEGCNT